MKNGWVLLIFAGFLSCQDIGTEIKMELTETSILMKSQYEKDLIKFSAYFGTVLTDKDAMVELFGFADLEGNAGDIEYSFRKLFEEQLNPKFKTKSAIVSAFKERTTNLRTNGEESAYSEFTSFIYKNDIEILAPYLARNFNPEEIDELTVSWWTQEMEDEGLAKDPNWHGETPAFKIKLNKENLFEEIWEALLNNDLEIFMVSDDYAMENPTIVIGAFGEDLYNLAEKASKEAWDNKQYHNVVPVNEGIKCQDVLSDDLVRYLMPDFRIRDNTRSWPNGNYISIWVAYSAYAMNNGAPVLNFSINKIIDEKKINRGDFSWKSNWVPPLLTHWDITNYSIQIIVAHKKKNIESSETASSTAFNPTSGATVTSSEKKTWNHTRIYGSNTWYRCQEINGAHTIEVPPTNLIRNGNAVWQMQSRDGRCEFTLEPRLTRW